MSVTNNDYGLIRTANRAKPSGTWPKRTEPNRAESDLSEPNRAELVTIHIASRAEPSRAEMKAVLLTVLNSKGVKPSVCIFLNEQYLVQKSL